MTITKRLLLLCSVAAAMGCGGCDDSNVGGDNNGIEITTSNNNQTTPTSNVPQCTDPTPCGDCDQDCRPGGNPFAPGASAGGLGFDGETCTADTDCKGVCGASGVCEGYGTGGFHGDPCSTDAECRGICDSSNTCEGFGSGTGYDGDSCTSDIDCRGTCGGTGVCEGGNGAGGGTGDGTDQNTCLDLEIGFEHAIPTLVLLIDQSGSTAEFFGNGMNRLQAAYTALMDPNDGLVRDIQTGFRVGMSLYSSYSDDMTCPEIGDVRPELNNYDPIERVFGQAVPLGGTPTGEAILGTLRQFDVHPDQGRKLLLIATDGEPNTCADPFNDIGQPEAIAAVQQAYQRDVETVILSLGDAVGRSHLEDMANAGVGLPIGGAMQADYYEANDPAQLKNELSAIIDSARSCIFRLQGGIIDPALVDRASVTVDGMVINYGDPNGWTYHQDRQKCEGAKQCIELTGASCDLIQDGQAHQIGGDFLCSYYDPENPPIGGGGGGTIGGGNNTPGPCVNPGMSCEYDGDCCSGVCGGGTCIAQ